MSLAVTFTTSPTEVSITRTTDLSHEGEVLEKTPDRGWVHYRTYGSQSFSSTSHATPIDDRQAARMIDSWNREAGGEYDSPGHLYVVHTDEEGFETSYTENAERTRFALGKDTGGNLDCKDLWLVNGQWILFRTTHMGGERGEDPEDHITPEEAGALVLAWKKEVGR